MAHHHPSLDHTAHRPWPMPGAPWGWRQSWRNLAFLHYRADPPRVRALLPSEIRLQEFDGSAWLGVVPFLMDDVMRGSLRALPRFSTFPELNLRTYVERDGKPGVWFFSLDAASLAIVLGGRHLYGLPYHLAAMSMANRGEEGFSFSSRRRKGGVRFEASYRPTGPVFLARPGTFEHWAAERYCLYSRSAGGVLKCAEVHHAPWPLQTAEARITDNDLFSAIGLTVCDTPPVCHFSTGVEVVSWGATPLPPA